MLFSHLTFNINFPVAKIPCLNRPEQAAGLAVGVVGLIAFIFSPELKLQ